MQIYTDFEGITKLFEQAQREDRDFLFEAEVYELIRLTGSETVPKYLFLPKAARLDYDQLHALPGEKVVLKIVSPMITHKSDLGGVRIVAKEPEKVLSAVRGMLYEVTEKYAAQIERHPAHAPKAYRGLSGDALTEAIARDIQGVLIVQFMPCAATFGSELIISLRRTREFGMIISAGLGGTDTELYAERLRQGQAIVAASTAMTDGETFFRIYQETISYKVLAGLTRGHKRIVTDEQLRECFAAFIALGNYFSPLHPNAPVVIEDLEINPFAFADYLMFPLDGLCRFARPAAPPIPRPVAKIDKLLHPASIGIIGVSAKEQNVGRTILANILAAGFDPAHVFIVHPGVAEIDGVATVPALEALPQKLDLLVLAVKADQIQRLVTEIIDRDLAESVILIPGGIGEIPGSEQASQEIRAHIRQAHLQPGGGPVFLGANSLGVLSQPGRYDSMFIPETLLPKHRGQYPRDSAIISQSGGYLISRLSNLAFLDPAYGLTFGNQFDLTASDLINFLNQKAEIHLVAAYLEGFNDADGLAFAQVVRTAVLQGKEVIFYKAGRTPEGKTATSGHTASLAGDYMVCESCIQQAGALVAETFVEFGGLLRLANALHHKQIAGNRLATVSNAGYEAVGMADNIQGEGYQLRMAAFTPETRATLTHILQAANLAQLVTVKNPLDLTPMATEADYAAVIEAILADAQVDALITGVTPFTPNIRGLGEGAEPERALTAADGIVKRIAQLAAPCDKPLLVVVDSGALFDPLVNAFQENGLPVFRSADQAVRTLAKYVQGRLRVQRILAEQK